MDSCQISISWMKDTTKINNNMIKSKEKNNWFLNFIYKDIDLEMHRKSLEERLESLQDNFMRSKKGSAKKIVARFGADSGLEIEQK